MGTDKGNDKGNSRIRLSFLDRIIRLDAEAARSRTFTSQAATIEQLEEIIYRDLTSLLNTRRAMEPLPAGFDDAANSLLTFGLPDFSGCSADDPNERQRFRREIETAIRRFEPRLTDVTVLLESDVTVAAGPDKKTNKQRTPNKALRYHVEAMLMIDPEPEPISFDAVLEPATGGVTIEPDRS